MKEQMKKIVNKNGSYEYRTLSDILENDKKIKTMIKSFATNANNKLKWTNNGFDYDDYIQMASMEVVQFFEVYNEKDSFMALMNTKMTQLFAHLARVYGNQKRCATNQDRKDGTIYNNISINATNDDGDCYDDIIGEEDLSYSNSTINLTIEKILSELNYIEKEIFKNLIYQNETQMELSARLDISRPTINKRVSEIRAKVSHYFEI